MWPNLDTLLGKGEEKEDEGPEEEEEQDLDSSEEDEILAPEQESRLVRGRSR